ncbi:MAG: metallophosphatase family protein [Planctomycetes bacterium]|nr:metallophosphatase family protein [Planctomycetota bacterium]
MFAIVSDIHANIEAMEAVLRDIESHGVSDIYCLGDVIGYGPCPVECIEIAMERFKVTLVGNHEEALVMGPYLFNKIAELAIFWTRDCIDSQTIKAPGIWKWMEGLPYFHQIENKLLVHGSPRDCATEYINPRDIVDATEKLYDIFEYVDRFCFVGHTHIPGAIIAQGRDPNSSDDSDFRYFHPGRSPQLDLAEFPKAIVNVGSVGQPRDGDNRACYAIVDGTKVYWRRVEYNYRKTMDRIFSNKSLHRELGARLEVGK